MPGTYKKINLMEGVHYNILVIFNGAHYNLFRSWHPCY